MKCRNREVSLNLPLSTAILFSVPLKLEKFDYWDPREAFEEERDENDEIIEEDDKYYKAIIKAGKRPSYGMEQVVPGDTDLNADGPILDAICYKNIGEIGIGQDILMDEIIADLRCLDAHAHLGNFLFDDRPEKALLHYEVGMKIGELLLPESFNGVLLWADIDNTGHFLDVFTDMDYASGNLGASRRLKGYLSICSG